MALIKALQKIETETLSVSVEKSIIDDLKLYGEFINSPRPYVVQELLRDALRRDKDFQAWRDGKRDSKQSTGSGRKANAATTP
jgi:hypothetical protein